MFRRKFFLIWSILLSFAVIAKLNELFPYTVSELDEIARSALPFASGLFATAVLFLTYKAAKKPYLLSGVICNLRSAGVGRTARCYKCRRKIQEYNGSTCQYCGWIRCQCGACGCGGGSLVS